jgi:hypothetical protein
MMFNAPLHMVDGSRLLITIRNETASALGTITFIGYGAPAAGFNRTICFMYDAFFGQVRMLWESNVDVPN